MPNYHQSKCRIIIIIKKISQQKNLEKIKHQRTQVRPLNLASQIMWTKESNWKQITRIMKHNSKKKCKKVELEKYLILKNDQKQMELNWANPLGTQPNLWERDNLIKIKIIKITKLNF